MGEGAREGENGRERERTAERENGRQKVRERERIPTEREEDAQNLAHAAAHSPPPLPSIFHAGR